MEGLVEAVLGKGGGERMEAKGAEVGAGSEKRKDGGRFVGSSKGGERCD